ncbi:hypothetical protein [Sorangium sp. So ce1153]|uniref:hypothetical protein n=1 Tax=Sorangium sp. So ce1153 TaxID=3133333 RepID=UPI003F5D8DE4
MHASKQERTSAFELTWSLSNARGASGDPSLKLEYKIEASEELYVGDRLWDYDDKRERVPDPFGVYRFVSNDSLRLVFAQAPYPPNVMPRIVYKPLFSRIRAGEARQREVWIKLPVDEYSSLARDVNAPTVLEEVSRVFLVLSYRPRSTMDHDPAPPPNETAESAGYIVHDPVLIISSLEVEPLPVKRRTGYIARFPLPGEPGPGPVPPPSAP